ncbi:hypothetical protein NTE_01701 [Candidatus Nitrososphaera evergladensis SR1]|uniref:Roadblock/LAMTOR2 domain-containing protein n=1 Tax=Candidatus Nitrososphaera evergladensis SR1 TaxID=1459636 RepID=A0A075MSJ4_9ARCH|nr:hypothetical protein [Candidatus Nitrososphaera evergladensis]AIF83762.1 hypothetical protein NTE_01701 [Candidatus Nitrososphaera evergladensis SR1]
MPSTVDDFCQRILEIDRGIRFAGIASSSGRLIGFAYRKGLKPLLTKEESETAVLQSLMRMNMRATLEPKLGRTIYAYTLYGKVKRATIPIRESSRITHIFMISFDLGIKHEPIIRDRIIPRLDELFS